MIYTIKSDKLTANISSTGAELVSLRSDEQEFIWQGGVWKEHAPLLFPACGRIVKDTYTYRGKVYQLMINGETGQVAGKSPLSALKIALLVTLGILAVGGLILGMMALSGSL